MSTAKTFEPFGNQDIPFAEPSWYLGNPTPYYEEKHAKWRKVVRDFVDKEIRPYANEWDEAQTFPVAELRKKAYNAGVLSPCWPVELGGTPPEGGWDHFMDLIWHDELARSGVAGVNIILVGITVMSLPHTLRYGSDWLKKKVAEPVIRGETGMSITLTEPHGGSDLARLRTTAVKSPCGKFYTINGMKKFITGGLTSSYFSTAVRTGGDLHAGVSLIVIPKDLPGVTVTKLKTSGWWCGNTSMVIFENVKVPVEYLIGEEGMGFMYLVDVMNWERMVAITGTARGSREVLAMAIEFARKRKTFGKPLVRHQVIAHKVANMAMQVEAVQNATEALTYQLANGADMFKVGGPIALLKVQATNTFEYCVREAQQIFGGASCLRQGKGQWLERAAREVRINAVGGGSVEILMDLAMRQSRL